MSRKLLFSLSLILIGLLSVSMISAQGPRPHDRRDHHPMPGGFDGHMGDMEITGSVNVSDAIIISLTVQPSEEAIAEMEARRDGMPRRHDGMEFLPEDMSNTITVRVDQLIEFVDLDGIGGYTENDTIISTYALDSTNLDDAVFSETDNGSLYTISSTDASFTMYLYLNEDDGFAHSWKWSVEMEYEFQNSTSSLAITQSVTSNGNRPIPTGPIGAPLGQPVGGEINRNECRDEHQVVPMFFKWDDTAIVDGDEVNVTASRIDDSIAISIPQGESIFYDPEVGVELDSLESVNGIIADSIRTFAQSINSPTVLALLFASGLIATIVIIRSRNR